MCEIPHVYEHELFSWEDRANQQEAHLAIIENLERSLRSNLIMQCNDQSISARTCTSAIRTKKSTQSNGIWSASSERFGISSNENKDRLWRGNQLREGQPPSHMEPPQEMVEIGEIVQMLRASQPQTGQTLRKQIRLTFTNFRYARVGISLRACWEQFVSTRLRLRSRTAWSINLIPLINWLWGLQVL